MSSSRSLVSAIVFAAGLVACSPGSASAKDTFESNDDGIVIEATSDGGKLEWSNVLRVTRAEVGEWYLFTSPVRPTSLAGVKDFDVEKSCGTQEACEVPGVGSYAGRSVLTAPGPVILRSTASSENLYLTLVRRGGPPPTLATVEILVDVEDYAGGCNPDAPKLRPLEAPR